jgi:hypothetical protein
MMRSLAIIASAVLILLAGCARSPVVLPPDSAPPAVVLDAYLTAIQAGNCEGARALATPKFSDGTDSYCRGLRVTGFGALLDPAQLNANAVEFSLDLSTSGGDETVPDGWHTWFFSLVRRAGRAWRVDGGGGGP